MIAAACSAGRPGSISGITPFTHRAGLSVRGRTSRARKACGVGSYRCLTVASVMFGARAPRAEQVCLLLDQPRVEPGQLGAGFLGGVGAVRSRAAVDLPGADRVHGRLDEGRAAPGGASAVRGNVPECRSREVVGLGG